MQNAGAPDRERPAPLGSWWRVYVLVAALAVLIMLLLWVLTAAYHVEVGA